MGIIPFQFLDGENSKNLKLTGKEKYTIHLSQELTVKQIVEIEVR
jgi:aconitase A